MSFLRPPSDDQPPDGQPDPLSDLDFQGDYPALFEYLTADRWPDGKARLTSTVLVCVDQGRFRVCLNDRALLKSAWVSAATFYDALGALERGIVNSSLEWRRNDYQKRRRS